MEKQVLFTDHQEYMQMEHLYNAALKQLQLRFEVLNDEFRVKHDRSPIHHIQSRLKSTKSIIKKLNKLGCAVSIPSAMQNINDLAGIRVVCNYIDDVYNVADMFLRQTDIRLIKKHDYIKTPNYNGYRSLHLDVEIPVFLSDSTQSVIAEIQIRTVAMDFWASLEHHIRYKSDKVIPQELCEQMLACADEIAIIDKEMQEMYKEIQKL